MPATQSRSSTSSATAQPSSPKTPSSGRSSKPLTLLPTRVIVQQQQKLLKPTQHLAPRRNRVFRHRHQHQPLVEARQPTRHLAPLMPPRCSLLSGPRCALTRWVQPILSSCSLRVYLRVVTSCCWTSAWNLASAPLKAQPTQKSPRYKPRSLAWPRDTKHSAQSFLHRWQIPCVVLPVLLVRRLRTSHSAYPRPGVWVRVGSTASPRSWCWARAREHRYAAATWRCFRRQIRHRQLS